MERISMSKSSREEQVPPDRYFHEARWGRMAEEAGKGVVPKIGEALGLREKVDWSDIAYKEALADNEQFDKRLGLEYKRWQEMLQEVIRDLRQFRDDPSSKEGKKVVNIKMGTGLGSALGVGQDLFFEDKGYTDTFDVILGSSGASGPAFLAAAKQSRIAASLYMNECTHPEFLSKSSKFPFINLDTGYIAEKMRHGEKALDQEAVRTASQEVYAIVSNKNTRKAELLNAKTIEPDMVTALEASSSIPFFRDAVEVDGEQYYDGAFTQLPIEEIVERFKPTHIVIQPNLPFREMASFAYTGAERALLFATRGMGSADSASTVEEFFRAKERTRQLLEDIGKRLGVKIAVVWPPDVGIGSLVNDPDTIRRAILERYRQAAADFGEKQPERIELYPGDIREMEEQENLKKAA